MAYLAAFAGVLCFRDPGAVVACSAALGPLIALLFRIAHDAGHHSHFRDRRLNSLVGHLCILPSYHPYSVWLLFHNKLHHGFTNLRSRDYIWIPLSKSEYDRLTPSVVPPSAFIALLRVSASTMATLFGGER